MAKNITDTEEMIPTNEYIQTSRKARDSVEGFKNTLRMMIFNYIQDRGLSGATCDEVEVALELRHQSASCIIRFLTKDNFLFDSGIRRKTRSGRQATVWCTRSIQRELFV